MICKWSVLCRRYCVVAFSSHSHACAGCCLRRQSINHSFALPCLLACIERVLARQSHPQTTSPLPLPIR